MNYLKYRTVVFLFHLSGRLKVFALSGFMKFAATNGRVVRLPFLKLNMMSRRMSEGKRFKLRF